MKASKLILKFNSPENGAVIPYDHQYRTYASLLNCIRAIDPDLAASLHQAYAAPRFVMSQIMGSGKKKFTANGFSSDRYVLILSSRETDLLEKIASAVESEGSLKFEDVVLPFHSYSLIPIIAPHIPVEFVTKSPIVVQIGDRYLRPGDDGFLKELKASILRKTAAIYPDRDIGDIRYLRLIDSKNKLCTVAGGKIPCSFIRFVIDASTEIIETVVTNGVGSKNQIGFGFVEVCQ